MDNVAAGRNPVDGGQVVTYKSIEVVRHNGDAVNSKLTLRLDFELIEKAKRYAKQRGKSLSRLVADYFAGLVAKQPQREIDETPPITAALWGLLEGTGVDEQDYYDYLEEKHK